MSYKLASWRSGLRIAMCSECLVGAVRSESPCLDMYSHGRCHAGLTRLRCYAIALISPCRSVPSGLTIHGLVVLVVDDRRCRVTIRVVVATAILVLVVLTVVPLVRLVLLVVCSALVVFVLLMILQVPAII